MKGVVLFLCLCLISCNSDEKHKVKLDSGTTIDSIEEEILLKPSLYEDSIFLTINNAEVGYYITIPKNFVELKTVKYDSSIYFSKDSSICFSKWVEKSYYPEFDYVLNKYGDIDESKIDSNKVLLFFEYHIDSLLDGAVIERRDGMCLFQKKQSSEKSILLKYTLCSVVGGTHAIVGVEVSYYNTQKDFVLYLLNSSSQGFRF